MNRPNHARGASFARRTRARVAIGAASVAGLTLFWASPVFAATPDDCLPANSLDADDGDDYLDIQALLDDVDIPIIWLTGPFNVVETLTFNRDVEFYGFPNALLDGDSDNRILEATDSGADLKVKNLTFLNGAVTGNGGAILGDEVTVENSRFANNSATGGFGGAISGNTVRVTGTTFFENVASEGGAIAGLNLIVVSSTFESNTAVVRGGAIVAGYTAIVANSTFVENSAGSGGGGAISGGYGTIVLSTFLDNTADSGTGQSIVASTEVPTEDLQLAGNIFAGSTPETQLAVELAGEVFDQGGNVFSTAAEPDLSSLTPSTLLNRSKALIFNGATLADNGGPTQTVALYAGSPAINAVPAGLAPISSDQRGAARSTVSDAGSFELAESPAPAALPPTGSPISVWVAAAASLLLAGGAVMVSAARRRRA